MLEEKTILQVLAEQKEEKEAYRTNKWTTRREESLFELDSPLAQVVIGVRRSGKSTICHKFLTEQKVNYGYANFDDDRFAPLSTEDLNTVLSCIYQLYGTDVRYIFLDEVQNVYGWHLFANRLLRQGLRLFITGSNANLLSGELATHLTGRYNEIRLYPFSFQEYCAFHNIPTRPLTTKEIATCKSALLDYMTEGGFPEIGMLRNKRGYVQSLIEAVLLKDIQKRFKLRNAEALRLTAHHLMNNTCQVVNFEELSKLLGISDKTLKKYVDYMQQAFLIQLLNKHSFKSKERIHNTKAYVVDTGFISNRENVLAPENLGWRLENVVYIELLRRCSNDFLDVYYYKTHPRAKEVDFAVCKRGRVKELIQVAYEVDTPKTFLRETSSLVSAAQALHCDNLTLIAFTQTRDVVVEGKTIHFRSALDWLLHEQAEAEAQDEAQAMP